MAELPDLQKLLNLIGNGTNQAALEASQLALKLAKKYQRRLHILHLSTKV